MSIVKILVKPVYYAGAGLVAAGIIMLAVFGYIASAYQDITLCPRYDSSTPNGGCYTVSEIPEFTKMIQSNSIVSLFLPISISLAGGVILSTKFVKERVKSIPESQK